MIWVIFSGSNVFAELEKLKGQHFVVQYDCDKTFAKKILSSAESYYKSIALRLGYRRYGAFWTFDNRCKIILYASRDDYIKKTGNQLWAGGHADLIKREIYSFVGRDDFIESVLPHEIAHLIFKDYVGLERNAALWLHEGVSVNSEKLRGKYLFDLARMAFNQGDYIPFCDLAKINKLSNVSDVKMVNLFYAEAVVIVNYLIEQHNSGLFVRFCRDIRDGYSIDKALYRNYAKKAIKNINDLEDKVRAYILA